jgi:membrane protease YdiL (CAAX protease family)
MLQTLPQKKLPAIAGVILSILSFFLALFVSRLLAMAGIQMTSAVSLFVSRIALWLWLLGVWFFAQKIEKQRLLTGTKKKTILFVVIAVIALLAYAVVISVILENLEKQFGLTDKSEKLGELIELFRTNKPLIFFTIFTAAIIEELFFRAYLISRLEKILKSTVAAVIISSLLFGLAHIGFFNIAQVINTTMLGLGSAIYFARYRDVKALIIAHFLLDMIGIYSQVSGH